MERSGRFVTKAEALRFCLRICVRNFNNELGDTAREVAERIKANKFNTFDELNEATTEVFEMWKTRREGR